MSIIALPSQFVPYDVHSTVCMFVTNVMQLEHDYQQLKYLLDQGLIPTTTDTINLLYNIDTVKREFSKRVKDRSEYTFFSWDEYLAIGIYFGQIFYLPQLPRVNHALNPNLGMEFIFVYVYCIYIYIYIYIMTM